MTAASSKPEVDIDSIALAAAANIMGYYRFDIPDVQLKAKVQERVAEAMRAYRPASSKPEADIRSAAPFLWIDPSPDSKWREENVLMGDAKQVVITGANCQWGSFTMPLFSSAHDAKAQGAATEQLIRAYNSGYKSGHHDTVEGQYTDIDQRDMSTYHADAIAEMITDGTLCLPATGVRVADGVCPECKGECGFVESDCGEGCCLVGVMCEACQGSGKVAAGVQVAPDGWLADLQAIDRAMQHMGDVLNNMDAANEGDELATEAGFEAIARLLAAAPVALSERAPSSTAILKFTLDLYAYLESTCPEGFANEAFRVAPEAVHAAIAAAETGADNVAGVGVGHSAEVRRSAIVDVGASGSPPEPALRDGATAEGAIKPVAWMKAHTRECTSDEHKNWMKSAGFGVWAEVAEEYTRPLFDRPEPRAIEATEAGSVDCDEFWVLIAKCRDATPGADYRQKSAALVAHIDSLLSAARKAAPGEQIVGTRQIDQQMRDAVAEGLRGMYGCSRVWSAWSVGTMTEDDFYPAEESDECIAQVVDAITTVIAGQSGKDGEPK